MHPLAALITVLTVSLMFAATFFVGRARVQHGVKAPATTGHPDFERAFRAQMNTLEQSVAFLPLLWLASSYGNERIAAYAGFAWLVGRSWYLVGYLQEARKRSMGFTIGLAASMVLLVQSLWGVGQALLAA